MSEPEVIYENKNFLVINKPAGLLVHRTRFDVRSKKLDEAELDVRSRKLDGVELGVRREKLDEKDARVSNVKHLTFNSQEETLVDWLVEKYPEVKGVGDDPETRPGIVHRLDKDTSGVMMVARNQGYFDYLKKLFQEHKIKKTYLVLVYGEPKEKRGVINKPIGLKPGTTKRTIFGGKMRKEAVTEYKLVASSKYLVVRNVERKKSSNSFSLLEVYPKTGRTHQIRVHLASIGNPVVNDKLYAAKKEKLGNGRLMLHAAVLEFPAEDGKRMQFEAELTKDFKENLY